MGSGSAPSTPSKFRFLLRDLAFVPALMQNPTWLFSVFRSLTREADSPRGVADGCRAGRQQRGRSPLLGGDVNNQNKGSPNSDATPPLSPQAEPSAGLEAPVQNPVPTLAGEATAATARRSATRAA